MLSRDMRAISCQHVSRLGSGDGRFCLKKASGVSRRAKADVQTSILH